MGKLSGPPLEQVKNEYQQMKDAPLYHVTPELTQVAVEQMKVEDETPQLLLARSGIMVFSEGTGLTQPCMPQAAFMPTQEVEIKGLQWFFEVDDSLVVNPIFDAADLRRIDGRLMPKKYYTGLFPFVEQRNLMLMMNLPPKLVQGHQLLKTLCALEPMCTITPKTIRVSRSKKETISVHYNVMELKTQTEIEEPSRPAPSMRAEDIPVFLPQPDKNTTFITLQF